MAHYDVAVIGAGLSGLTAAALLAKRGLHVAVVDQAQHPGGACGAFRRGDALIDQGAAMLFGFGSVGFNPHRFVFNALEEPIDVIRHKSMYAMDFAGERIEFVPDINRFTDEVARLFPDDREAIKRFYADMEHLYNDVIAEAPMFTTPDEMDLHAILPRLRAHPRSYFTFLRLMNKSVKDLIGHYFTNPRMHQFFDKLCSTYCYTTAAETPAVLGAVMFVDNHVGGTYYPAGSSAMVPGKLEKVIEEHGGDMLMGRQVTRILFRDNAAPFTERDTQSAALHPTTRSTAHPEKHFDLEKRPNPKKRPAKRRARNCTPCGIACRKTSGTQTRRIPQVEVTEHIFADTIIYAGNVWDLYAHLLPHALTTRKERAWAARLIPTEASAVVYLVVDARAIPPDALPVEMFAAHPEKLNDDEITAYIMSLDDPSLCPPDQHVLTVVGPCFDVVDDLGARAYAALKNKITHRFLNVLEGRFPGISSCVLHAEVATPRTLARFANKYHGAVAGPKQMMGQHMLKRQHTRTRWSELVCCGESTVMGTGTPTVSISGIAAANAVLRDRGLVGFTWQPNMREWVRDVPSGTNLCTNLSLTQQAARHCLWCAHPTCNRTCPAFDIPGIMRRVCVGNLVGARKLARAGVTALDAGTYLVEPQVAAHMAAHMISQQQSPTPLQRRHAGDIFATLATFERDCIRAKDPAGSTPISLVIAELLA